MTFTLFSKLPDARRLTVILVMGVPLLWLSIAISIAGIFARNDPERVLRWWPWSADAQSALSSRLSSASSTPSPRNLTKGVAAAQRAIHRQPISPVAARSLAVFAAFDSRTAWRALSLMRFSESLTRHDAPTQLWLIETNVERGDIVNALVHYDRALRTSLEVRRQILPVLVNAADDPTIARPLARLLVAKPSWRDEFIALLVTHSKNPFTLGHLLSASGLSTTSFQDRGMIGVGLTHMAQLGAPRAAFAAYRRLGSQIAGYPNRINNGSFARDPGLLPFDWWLADDPNLVATREIDENGGYHIRTSIAAGASGVVARQLVLLEAGQYALKSEVAEVESSNSTLTLKIDCVNTDSLFKQVKSTSNKLQGSISVPVNCSAAWISFEANGDLDGSPQDYLIKSISLIKK